MKAVCKNPKNYNLSLEKPYEVISILNDFYVIQNDKGLVRSYNKALFNEPVEEEPVPVKPDFTLEDMVTSVDFSTPDNISIFFEIGDYKHSTVLGFETDDVSGNCGIRAYEGINEATQTIYDEIMEICEDLALNYTEEQVTDIIVSILKELLNQIIVNAANDNKAMVVFSTNDEYSDSVWKVFDTASSLQTNSVKNPGSGSEIKLWIFYV
ncbi:MAG: hypothetical protein ACOC3V_00870 [bacterium]